MSNIHKAIVIVALVAGPIAARAATTYDINFAVKPDCSCIPFEPPTGQFTYDGVSFSAFTVTWNRRPFDFTAIANTPSPTAIGSCGVVGGAALTFLLMTGAACGGGTPEIDFWSGGGIGTPVTFGFTGFGSARYRISVDRFNDVCDCGASGKWTASAQVPLPGGFALLAPALVALGWVKATRYRHLMTVSPKITVT